MKPSAYEGCRLTPAQQFLVSENTRLVSWYLGRYFSATNHYTYQEAYSAGLLGLVQAALRFDPARGVAFGTYAVWWVWQSVVRDRHNNRVVHVPHTRGRNNRMTYQKEKQQARRVVGSPYLTHTPVADPLFALVEHRDEWRLVQGALADLPACARTAVEECLAGLPATHTETRATRNKRRMRYRKAVEILKRRFKRKAAYAR